MVWDLRAALLRKEEIESARLTDFEFREMVRAMKRLARELTVDSTTLLDKLADHGEPAALAWLAAQAGRGEDEIDTLYTQARAEARRRLIAERGDPSPVRLG